MTATPEGVDLRQLLLGLVGGWGALAEVARRQPIGWQALDDLRLPGPALLSEWRLPRELVGLGLDQCGLIIALQRAFDRVVL